MRMLGPTGYPANRTAGRWVSDVLVTVVAAAAAGPVLFHNGRHPTATAGILLVLAAVPLLVRRTWPIPVFVVVLALTAVAGLVVNDHAVNGLALLIALYTVAGHQETRK